MSNLTFVIKDFVHGSPFLQGGRRGGADFVLSQMVSAEQARAMTATTMKTQRPSDTT